MLKIIYANRIHFLDYVVFLFFCAIPFRDLRIISFISIQDILLLLGLFMVILKSKETQLDYGFLYFTAACCTLIAITTGYRTLNYTESLINVSKVLFAYGLMHFFLVNYAKLSYHIYSVPIFGLGAGLSLVVLTNVGSFFSTGSLSRLVGFSGHANYFAFSGIILFTGGIYLSFNSVILKSLKLYFIFVGFLAVIMSVSSTAIFVLYFVLRIKFFEKEKLFTRIPILFALTAIFYYSFENLAIFNFSRIRLREAFTTRYSYSIGGTGNTSIQDRLQTYVSSWDRILANPLFGYGLNQKGRLTNVGIETHNYLLLSWQTGGIIFLIFQIVLIIYVCKSIHSGLTIKFSLSMAICCWFFLMTEPWIYERTVCSTIFLIIAVSKQKHVRNLRKNE